MHVHSAASTPIIFRIVSYFSSLIIYDSFYCAENIKGSTSLRCFFHSFKINNIKLLFKIIYGTVFAVYNIISSVHFCIFALAYHNEMVLPVYRLEAC